MRYYFHLSERGCLARDEFGEEFESQEEARGYATRIAHELARNRKASMCDSFIKVVDDAGRVLFNVPLPLDE
jgi:hypothetical protein